MRLCLVELTLCSRLTSRSLIAAPLTAILLVGCVAKTPPVIADVTIPPGTDMNAYNARVDSCRILSPTMPDQDTAFASCMAASGFDVQLSDGRHLAAASIGEKESTATTQSRSQRGVPLLQLPDEQEARLNRRLKPLTDQAGEATRRGDDKLALQYWEQAAAAGSKPAFSSVYALLYYGHMAPDNAAALARYQALVARANMARQAFASAGAPPDASEMADRAADRLLLVDSKSWLLDKYVPGSASVASAPNGSGAEFRINYLYLNANPVNNVTNQMNGWVNVRKKDQGHICLEFHNLPLCRPVGTSSTVILTLLAAAGSGGGHVGGRGGASNNDGMSFGEGLCHVMAGHDPAAVEAGLSYGEPLCH